MSDAEKEALAESRQDAEFWGRKDVGVLVERLRAGLGGVTPGPWYPHDHNNQNMADDPEYWMGYAWVGWNRTDRSGNFDACLARLERQKDGSKDFRSRASRDAAHIALCSGENIRALLDALLSAQEEAAALRMERDEWQSKATYWKSCTEKVEILGEDRKAKLADAVVVLEPFEVIARELFARNFNKKDVVFTLTGVSTLGYPVELSLTFEAFYPIPAFITSIKEPGDAR